MVRVRLLGTVHMYGWLVEAGVGVYILVRKPILVREQKNENPGGRPRIVWTTREGFETYAIHVRTGSIYRVGNESFVESKTVQRVEESDFLELLVAEDTKPSKVLTRLGDFLKVPETMTLDRTFCGGWRFMYGSVEYSVLKLFRQLPSQLQN